MYHKLPNDSAATEKIKDTMQSIIKRLDRYKNLKEKADGISEWNDIVHDLSNLLSDYGTNMPDGLRENLQTVLDYTSPPQDEVDALKSSMEEVVDIYDGARMPDQHNHISRMEIVMMGIAAALIIASCVAFYLTQYAVATIKVVNDNCSPMKFENQGQLFNLAKVPKSLIEKGGYARILVPAGAIAIESDNAGTLEIRYSFGQSVILAISDDLSGLQLDGSAHSTNEPFGITLSKDGSGTLIVTCS